MTLFSCTSEQEGLERENQELIDSLNLLKQKYQQKDSLFDSINSEYLNLREKMTKHVKYVYTVYDEVIRDEEGNEWDFSDFLSEYCGDYDYIHTDDVLEYVSNHYDKSDIIDYFGISSDDFDYDYEPDYDERWEPRAP